jgi:hypothetical protein
MIAIEVLLATKISWTQEQKSLISTVIHGVKVYLRFNDFPA